MYKLETRKHIENALCYVLAADGVLPDLDISDPQALKENIHLLATKLADQLWTQGYELSVRSRVGMPGRPSTGSAAVYYEGS